MITIVNNTENLRTLKNQMCSFHEESSGGRKRERRVAIAGAVVSSVLAVEAARADRDDASSGSPAERARGGDSMLCFSCSDDCSTSLAPFVSAAPTEADVGGSSSGVSSVVSGGASDTSPIGWSSPPAPADCSPSSFHFFACRSRRRFGR